MACLRMYLLVCVTVYNKARAFNPVPSLTPAMNMSEQLKRKVLLHFIDHSSEPASLPPAHSITCSW